MHVCEYAWERERKNVCMLVMALEGASLVDEMVKKKCACNAGDPGSIPGLQRSPREGNVPSRKVVVLERDLNDGQRVDRQVNQPPWSDCP